MNVIFFHNAQLYKGILAPKETDDGTNYVSFYPTSDYIEYMVKTGSSLVISDFSHNYNFIEELNKLNTKKEMDVITFLNTFGNVIGFEAGVKYPINIICIMIERLKILINLYNTLFSKTYTKKKEILFFRYFFENPDRYTNNKGIRFHVPKITRAWYKLKKYYLAHDYDKSTNFIEQMSPDYNLSDNGVYIDKSQEYLNIRVNNMVCDNTDLEDDNVLSADTSMHKPYFSEPLLKSIPTSLIRTKILSEKDKYYSSFFIKLNELYSNTNLAYVISDEGECTLHSLTGLLQKSKFHSADLEENLKKLVKDDNILNQPTYIKERTSIPDGNEDTESEKPNYEILDFARRLISAEEATGGLPAEKCVLSDDFNDIMNAIIKNEINSLFKNVKPRLSEKMDELHYETKDLLSIILVSIVRAFDHRHEQRNCKNENCIGTFIAPIGDNRKFFCCIKCKNAHNQRLLRANKYAQDQKKKKGSKKSDTP